MAVYQRCWPTVVLAVGRVTINGEQVELSDGAWGCVAYSAITSLAEADMAMAFEYYLDTDYSFGSDFQAKTAEYLAAEYMGYINAQNLSVDEAKLGLDVDGDGALTSTVALSIEYDAEKYAETNGYGGTYLDLYLAEFTDNLQWYLDNLDYGEGWTWFDADGNALSDEDVAAMTSADKAQAFIEGRYDKGSSGGMGGPGGDMGGAPSGEGGPGGEAPSGMSGGPGDGAGGPPSGEAPSGAPSGAGPDASAATTDDSAAAEASEEAPDAAAEGTEESSDTERSFENADVAANSTGDTMDVGTPDAGTTQAAGSGTDSSNYASYADMLAAYQSDVAEVLAGDAYGNNIVELYDPLNYIGAEATDAPTWTRVVMGASEGDMSMFSSLNMQIGWLASGTDATIEWQWDGGHVPSEVLGNSLALWVDTMYGEYVDGAVKVEKPAATAQTANGDAESASGTDISSWVDASDLSKVSFTLADAASYRTAGAAKAIPGFDVIDYGQEDYVFGSATADARHWDERLLKVFEENAETLEPLFNAG